MKKQRTNWNPVVASLLSKLQQAGFTLVSAEGQTLEGTDRDRRQQAKKYICAVEESYLYVEDSEGVSKWLFIVLGNEAHEIVNDCSCSGLDDVLDEFENHWINKV